MIEVGGKGDKRPKVDLESENRDVIFPQLSRKGGLAGWTHGFREYTD